ncbi:MAG: hypothetical protein ACD_61C00040G0005 [uncultured bacterium]|nr:MAG: hypothetical protein ACD_61C00040G0005 [uncultured bacterium]
MAIGPFFLGNFWRKEVRNVKEKFVFEPSDIVNNKLSKEEIEFWGHEAGEFFPELLEESQKIELDFDKQENKKIQ